MKQITVILALLGLLIFPVTANAALGPCGMVFAAVPYYVAVHEEPGFVHWGGTVASCKLYSGYSFYVTLDRKQSDGSWVTLITSPVVSGGVAMSKGARGNSYRADTLCSDVGGSGTFRSHLYATTHYYSSPDVKYTSEYLAEADVACPFTT